ncbi:MAG: hypothetical protein GEU73_04080 [Chloroflexi bacterium]|nr:hypothetical protein [Chloroflexota bacterium]
MTRLSRKNLVVDAERVRDLASSRHTSESEAVREAVELALSAEDVMAAVRELHAQGGLDDVFGRLPDDAAAASPPA